MRILFLILSFLSLSAQGQIVALSGTLGDTGATQIEALEPLSSIPYKQVLWSGDSSIHNIARVDSLYHGVIGVPAEYEVEWALIDSRTTAQNDDGDLIAGDTLVSGTGHHITYVFGDEHRNNVYDIQVRVWWGTEGKELYIQHGIANVFDYIYTIGGAGITSYNLSSSIPSTPPATDRVLMYGNGNGRFQPRGWDGVSIQFAPGTTITSGTAGSGCIEIRDDCSGMSLDGCTDNSVDAALTLIRTTGSDCFSMNPDYNGFTPASDSLVVAGVRTDGGSSGFHIEAYQFGSDPSDPNAWSTLKGINAFNFYIKHCDAEGAYIFWTRDYNGYMRNEGNIFHHFYIDSVGWDCYQLGNSINTYSHDIYLSNCGLLDNSNQFSNISINGCKDAVFYNITSAGGHKGFTGSTGQYSGNVHIFNSVFDNTGEFWNESLQFNWYRLGDGGSFADTVDMFVYQNTFIDNTNGPYGHYENGVGATGRLNFQWADNSVSGDPFSAPSSSNLVDNGIVRHWLSYYDENGLKDINR